MAEKLNILLITAGALNTGDLGCYGSGANSASIDSLAAGGTLCESYFCTAIPGPESLAGLLTGQHPASLGMASRTEISELPFETSLLQQAFLSAGYTTCAFDNLRRRWHWFGKGFEFY